MSKPVIAIDIDDVLSSQVDVFIEFSNTNYGMSLTRADFDEPSMYWGLFEKIWGVDEAETTVRLKRFQDEYVFRQVVTDEVKQAISKLRETYELEIVTSRQAKYRGRTITWLEQHLPRAFRGVQFVELWDQPGRKATKAKICTEIGAGYLVDDSAEHCNLAAEAGVGSLLFGDFGWSKQQELHPDVTRVTDWQAVVEYFDARS